MYLTSKGVQKKIKEIGTPGTEIYYGYLQSEEFNPSWNTSNKWTYIDSMIKTDAQIYAVLLAHKLPILKSIVDVEPASEDNIDKKIAEETKKELFENSTFDWFNIHEHILKFFEYGFYLFEKAPYVGQDGKFHFKLAPRMPRTIDQWVQADDGTLDHIVQSARFPDGNWKQIPIPNDKLVLFNINQEGNNWVGESLLRPIYKNHKAKDLLIKLDTIAKERWAVPVPKIELPENEQDGDFERAQTVGETYRSHEKGYIVQPFGWNIDAFGGQGAGVMNIIDSMTFHNKEITGAFLANFLLVGMTEAGTYNLVENKQDMFMTAITAYARRIEKVMNERIQGRSVIRDFVDWNFKESGAAGFQYPKFKYNKIMDIDIDKLANTLTTLKNGGFLAPTESIAEYLIAELGLPETPDVKGESKLPPKVEAPKEPADKKDDVKDDADDDDLDKNDKTAPQKACDCNHDISLMDIEERLQYRLNRQMTDTEKRIVNFTAVTNELNDKKQELYDIGNKYRKQMIEKLIKRAVGFLTSNKSVTEFKKDLDKYCNTVAAGKWMFQGAMASELTRPLKEVYKFGQNQVKAELQKQGIKLTAEQIIADEGAKLIRPVAELSVQSLVQKLINEFRTLVTKQKIDDTLNIQAIGEFLTKLSFNDFKREITGNLTRAFGQGRSNIASKAKNDIYKVVRSEIQDNNICKNCDKIDNYEFTMDDPFYNLVARGPFDYCEGGDQCRGMNIYLASE